MHWLTILTIGLFIWSLTALADRYALQRFFKNKISYTLLPAFIGLPCIIFLFFTFDISLQIPSVTVLAAAIGAGIAEFVFTYLLFVALSKEEASKVFPLAASGPFATLFLAWLFLGEIPSGKEMIAFVLFVIGGAFLAIERAHGKIRFSGILLLLILGPLLFSISIVLFKSSLSTLDIWNVFFFSRIGMFAAGASSLFFPRIRDSARAEWRSLPPQMKTILVGNQVVAVFGHLFYFSALTRASAALVNAAFGIQYVIIFILASAISFWKPHWLHEDTSRRTLIKKSIGIVFIAVAVFTLHY